MPYNHDAVITRGEEDKAIKHSISSQFTNQMVVLTGVDKIM